MRFRQRLLGFVAEAVSVRPTRVITLAIAATCVSLFFAYRGLEIDTDLNNLLPSDDPVVQEMSTILEEFGGLSHLMFLVDGATAPERDRFADELAQNLSKRPDLFQSVTSRLPLEWFRRRSLLYLEDEARDDLTREIETRPEAFGRILHAENAEAMAQGISNLLDTAFLSGDSDLEADDDARSAARLEAAVSLLEIAADERTATDHPALHIDELEHALDALFSPGDSQTASGLSERLHSHDDEATLVIARAARSTLSEDGRAFIRETMDGARSAMDGATRAIPGPRVRVTGPLPQQEVEEKVIRADFQVTGRAAALLITFLLILSLRMWIAPILAMLPLIMAVAWELGLVSATLGRLNVFSIMFVAVVLGLGVDFGIHLLVRYGEESTHHADPAIALRRAITATGTALTTGALSTVLAFGALIFSDYVAFRELGLVSFSGISLAFVAFVTVMPALILKKDQWVSVRPQWSHFRTRGASLLPLGKFGENIQRHVGFWAVGLSAVTLISIALVVGVPDVDDGWGRGLRFEGNLLAAQPDTPAHALQREIVERFEMAGESFYVRSPDLETTRAHTRILESFKGSDGQPLLGRMVSAATFVPPDQEHRARESRSLWETLANLAATPPSEAPGAGPESFSQVGATLLEIGDLAYLSGLEETPALTPSLAERMHRLSLRSPAEDAEGVADRHLALCLASRRAELASPEQLRPFGPEDLPEPIRSQVLGKSGQFLISAYGRYNTYDDDENARAVAQVREAFPRAAGLPVLFADLLSLSRREGVRSAQLACVLVFLAVLADARRLRYAIVTVVPLAFGIIWTLGAMSLIGLDFNFANVVAAPLLLGIGIDDGVHMMHRYREEGPGRIPAVLQSTGRAVVLTSLTTMIGFGVFELAHHQGLESLGRVMVIGVFSCLLGSLTALPTLLVLLERWPWRLRRR